MKNPEIKIKNPEFVKVDFIPPPSTMFTVMPTIPYQIFKNQHVNYERNAKTLLDHLSADYNAIGINALIAELILQTHGNRYFGIKNED